MQMDTNTQPLLCISRSVVSMVTLYQLLLCTSSSVVSMITLYQQLLCISGSFESMVTLYWQLLCISSSVVSMITLYQQLVTSYQYILLLARVHVQAPVSQHLSPIDCHLLLTPCFICLMLFHASIYVIFQVIRSPNSLDAKLRKDHSRKCTMQDSQGGTEVRNR